jgi:hypothetical protein
MVSACGVRGRQCRRELLAELDLRRAVLAQLQRHGNLDAAARHLLLHQRAQARLEVGDRRRQPQLQVEEAVIDRPNRDANRAALVVARQRRKAGHALDHRELSAFWAAA